MALNDKTSAVTTAENDDQQVNDGMFEIPHDYLIEGVKEAVKSVHKMLNDARKKHGNHYNEKNDWELFSRKFGYNDPEKLWAEFELIWQKKSKQPAAVRKVIQAIGLQARTYALRKYAMEHGTTENKKSAEE
jgi:hypothetical protein